MLTQRPKQAHVCFHILSCCIDEPAQHTAEENQASSGVPIKIQTCERAQARSTNTSNPHAADCKTMKIGKTQSSVQITESASP